jgi:hypothetical protein
LQARRPIGLRRIGVDDGRPLDRAVLPKQIHDAQVGQGRHHQVRHRRQGRRRLQGLRQPAAGLGQQCRSAAQNRIGGVSVPTYGQIGQERPGFGKLLPQKVPLDRASDHDGQRCRAHLVSIQPLLGTQTPVFGGGAGIGTGSYHQDRERRQPARAGQRRQHLAGAHV